MAKQEVSISELVVLLIGARFPDCDFFFIKSEKYMSIIVTCHNIHVCVLYYKN